MAKIYYKVRDYDQWIELQGNRVINFSCTCHDFIFRSIDLKKQGILRPCKHLNEVKRILDEGIQWNKGLNE